MRPFLFNQHSHAAIFGYDEPGLKEEKEFTPLKGLASHNSQ